MPLNKGMYICANYFNLHTTADTKGFNKMMDELFEKKTKFEVLDTFEEIGVKTRFFQVFQ